MALINWDESFSVNVTELDKQHKKLITMINELSDAMKQGKGKDTVGKILNDMVGYALVHFHTEEKYFDLFDYPEAEIHKKEHNAFAHKVSDYKETFEKGSLTLPIKVMDFLYDWLQNHIKGMDRKYSGCFNGNGLK